MSVLDEDAKKHLFEEELNKIAGDARHEIEAIVVKNISKDNNIYKSITSGAKGKKINITQIMGSIGQQSIDGKRIEFTFTERTLPYFHKNDYSLESRGYCKNSYIEGSNMIEFFYQAVAGRNNMTDTALKTADTGYTQRKLVKMMEDMKIGYNNTVLNETKNIIQFYYGCDSFQPTQLEKCLIKMISYDDRKMENYFLISEFDEKENNLSKNIISERRYYLEEYDIIKKSRDDLREIYFSRVSELDDVRYYSPINLKRIITLINSKFENVKDEKEITPKYITESFQSIFEEVEKKIFTGSFNICKNTIVGGIIN